MGSGPLPQPFAQEDSLKILGIVAALRSEARTLARLQLIATDLVRLPGGTLLSVAGMGGSRARAAAELLKTEGATALLSWGSAGALHPKLSPGSLILPKTVIVSQEVILFTDAAWHNRLLNQLSGHFDLHTDPLLQSFTVLASPKEKFDFFKQNDAIAVDMESGSVAEVANRANLPFMAIRAVADTSDMTIPSSALNAIDEYGRLRLLQLLNGLVRNPPELFSIARLSRNYRAARTTLAKVARLVGDNLLAW